MKSENIKTKKSQTRFITAPSQERNTPFPKILVAIDPLPSGFEKEAKKRNFPFLLEQKQTLSQLENRLPFESRNLIPAQTSFFHSVFAQTNIASPWENRSALHSLSLSMCLEISIVQSSDGGLLAKRQRESFRAPLTTFPTFPTGDRCVEEFRNRIALGGVASASFIRCLFMHTWCWLVIPRISEHTHSSGEKVITPSTPSSCHSSDMLLFCISRLRTVESRYPL